VVDAVILEAPEVLLLPPDISRPNVNRLYGGTSSRDCHLELHKCLHAVVIVSAGTGPFVVRIKRGGRVEGCFGVTQAGKYEQ